MRGRLPVLLGLLPVSPGCALLYVAQCFASRADIRCGAGSISGRVHPWSPSGPARGQGRMGGFAVWCAWH